MANKLSVGERDGTIGVVVEHSSVVAQALRRISLSFFAGKKLITKDGLRRFLL